MAATTATTIMGPMPMAEAATTSEAAALYRLITWLSPAYPVGAFAWSQGLEAAIVAGRIGDADALCAWIEDVAECGALWSDAVLLARGHDAAARGDAAGLADIGAFALAVQPTREMSRETVALGTAFLATTRAAWPCAALDLIEAERCVYPLAVAVAAAGHGIAGAVALGAYLHGCAANLVSAAVRLVPLGQTDGQRVIARLEGVLARVAERAAATGLEGLATACFRADISSMHHETQHTRLFRS
jgi:urease accessory protein